MKPRVLIWATLIRLALGLAFLNIRMHVFSENAPAYLVALTAVLKDLHWLQVGYRIQCLLF